VSRGWALATVGGAPIVSCPVEGLGKSGQEVSGAGAGFRAWGGDLELKEIRWMPL
jgi:hypothetical protein